MHIGQLIEKLMQYRCQFGDMEICNYENMEFMPLDEDFNYSGGSDFFDHQGHEGSGLPAKTCHIKVEI